MKAIEEKAEETKGYIYTMGAGSDPGHGWVLNDPIFGRTPTLGVCVPNIRRAVQPGDYVFVVSGKLPGVQQFVVGGFRVSEKIDALAAYKRFPENRLRVNEHGQVEGNILVDGKGKHHPLDDHDGFEQRFDNYLVGTSARFFDNREEYNVAREDTLDVLSNIFKRDGKRVFDLIGRHRKMTAPQVQTLLNWIESIKP